MLFPKTVKSLSVALGLAIMLGTCIYASESEEAFGGFSKGFLFPSTQPNPQGKGKIKKPTSPNFGGLKTGFLTSTPLNSTSEKPQRKVVSQDTSTTTCSSSSLSSSISLNPTVNEESPTERKIPKSLWSHPYPYTKEAREKLYQSFSLKNMESIAGFMERELCKLFPPTKEGIVSVCNNPNFLAYFISFKYLFENFSLYKERAQESVNLEKAHPVPFIMQVIEHQVLKSYFQHMGTLTGTDKQRFKKRFITEESDENRGEFVFEKSLWSQLTNGQQKPCVRYFADSLGSLNPNYHLYFEKAPGLINFSFPITNNPGLGFRGDFELVEFASKDHYDSAGYILDVDHRLITTPGLVFVKREFSKECEFLYYDRHPTFDQMFFFEIASIFDKNKIDSQLVPFLDLIGGIERLDRDDFVFIPDPNPDIDTTVSPSTARLILPYLYELKEAAQQNLDYLPEQIGWIDETITKLTTILVEENCAQEGMPFNNIIMSALLEEEIQEEPNTEDIKKIGTVKDPIQNHTNATLKEGHQKDSKILKKTRKMKQIKEQKSPIVDPHLIQQQRKEKILARIEKEYREKVSKKKNFSSHEVQELLGEMVEALSPLGIERTGEAHSHGSHAAAQIVDKTSNRSTHVGIAKRPQKRGYQSGTVKIIIKDMIHKVSLIVLKEKS